MYRERDDFFYGCIEASRKINEQIAKLQRKRDLLLEIDKSNPVDMSTWKKVLNTPLFEDKDALVSMLQGTFPGAKNPRYNYQTSIFFFDYKGFEIALPVIDKVIFVDMDWYYNDENGTDKTVEDEKLSILVEDVLPKLEAFGSTGVYQWGITNSKYAASKNDANFDDVKKEYYEYKKALEERAYDLKQEEELNME